MVLAAVFVTAGCSASKKEIRKARSSGYEADFAVVYSQVLERVRKLYPRLSEDARAGVIRTSWHPIRISSQGTDDGMTAQQRDQLRAQQRNDPNMATGALSGSGQTRKQFYIRFDVRVIGGKPWRVSVKGHASEWELGAVPVQLRGADTPHWLKGREDALYVAIYRDLKGYAVPLETNIEEEVEVVEVDYSKYGLIPQPAAEAVHAVAAAAAARDYTALRAAMVDQFVWSLGGDASADQAIVMWQADATVLAELSSAIAGGCAEVNQNKVACPANALSPGFTGYAAAFGLSGGRWAMTAFVRQE